LTFHLNCEIGRDLSLEDLRSRHDAVLIATGVLQGARHHSAGRRRARYRGGARLSHRLKPHGLGDTVAAFESGALDARGKNVVVIGGGDTAMDCVRTAVRQGAKSVKCLYRRDRANMPFTTRGEARRGRSVDFVWLSAPQAFLGDDM